jgi:thiamine biosynthesis lipoprotein
MVNTSSFHQSASAFLALFFLAGSALLPLPLRGSTLEPYKEMRPLLHTVVEITAYGANAERATGAAFKEMERINRLLNNYSPASEISQINRAAGVEAVAVTPETMEALSLAKYYGELSGGAMDVTVGPLLKLWGFAREEPSLKNGLPPAGVLSAARQLVDFRLILLDAVRGTSRLSKRGMWIDTGSFTKGYAADCASRILKKEGITRALITAGGTVLALGKKPGGIFWQVGIRHPREEEGLLGVVSLEGRAISTSGDYERFYRLKGKRLCHIIDPRSGHPVESVQSISVLAPTALASDFLSTALFVLGTQDGLSLIKNLPGVEAMMVDREGGQHFSPGWPIR